MRFNIGLIAETKELAMVKPSIKDTLSAIAPVPNTTPPAVLRYPPTLVLSDFF